MSVTTSSTSMSTPSPSTKLDRTLIERLVRESLRGRFPRPQTSARNERPDSARVSGAPRLVVNVSARHCHVTQEDLERLFGTGHKLTPMKALYQDGFFAAEEAVTLIGPRHRLITGLRILGPCRDHSQVELAFTDAITLGLEIPVRKSGDHRDSPGAYLMGPKGMIELKTGVIRHERHVHMGPSDAVYYGVKDGERMSLRIHSDCPTLFEGVLVRVASASKLEVHLDTDEGNASNLARARAFELFV